jgi:hypothetical protein
VLGRKDGYGRRANSANIRANTNKTIILPTVLGVTSISEDL